MVSPQAVEGVHARVGLAVVQPARLCRSHRQQLVHSRRKQYLWHRRCGTSRTQHTQGWKAGAVGARRKRRTLGHAGGSAMKSARKA